MRRLASHVSRSKRADKRWTTTTRPTPLNYESFSNEATLPLFLARSSATTTRPLSPFFISRRVHPFLPRLYPALLKRAPT